MTMVLLTVHGGKITCPLLLTKSGPLLQILIVEEIGRQASPGVPVLELVKQLTRCVVGLMKHVVKTDPVNDIQFTVTCRSLGADKTTSATTSVAHGPTVFPKTFTTGSGSSSRMVTVDELGL